MRRSPTPPILALLFAAAVASAAVSPSEFLPPAPVWQGASEALVRPADDPWSTPAEKTNLTGTASYADTVAWLERLAEASPRIKLLRFGKTSEGRELVMVIAADQEPFDHVELRLNGRPTLLAQAGIHAGEIDGKDAGLMLLRDLAFGNKGDLLKKANLLFIPVLNADGHERVSEFNRPNQRGPERQGWRTTARNLNLNRDYTKLDAPEMIALLRLIRNWQPQLYLDLHVTDGIDYQYDITYGFHGWNGGPAWSPKIGQWLDQVYRPAVDRALADAGHIPGGLVFAVNNRDFSQGLFEGNADPRFSHGYGDLRHLPSVLVENHSLKPYRQRVLGTYVLLEASLRALGENADTIRAAIATDSASRPTTLAANWSNGGGGTRQTDFAGIAFEEYVSPVSGSKEVRWLGTPQTFKDVTVVLDRPAAQLRRPVAYYVPATYPQVIQKLQQHGIRLELLDKARTVDVELYRLVDPKPAATPFEGRHVVRTGVAGEKHAVTFPVGSVRVPTDQALGDLAVLLLEPESVDSFLAWGFFPEIFQRTEYIEGYVLAPLAEKMLAQDPKLKADFEAKLAADEKFRASPDARLRWFYERSPFYDSRYLLYPVGIER
jgi:hypothetical protein